MPRRRSRRFSRYLGWLLFGAALVVLALGRSGEVTVLGLAGIAAVALTIVAVASSAILAARFLSTVALVVALVALASAIGLPVLPGAEPIQWMVLAVLLAGSLALSGVAWGSRRFGHVSLAMGGLTLLGVGITAVFVRLVGLFDLYPDRGFGAAPVGLILTSLLLGIVLIVLVWWDNPDPTAYPESALSAVAVAGLVASLLLWRTLVEHEQLQVERLTQNESASAVEAVHRAADAASRVLHQFALLSQDRGDSVKMARGLAQLLRDTPSVEMVALVDSTGMPIMVRPEGADASAIAATVPTRAVGRLGSAQEPVAHLTIPGLRRPDRYVIHAANCVAGSCPGGAAAIVTAERLIQRALGMRSEWMFTLGAAQSHIALDNYRTIGRVDIPGLDWLLTTEPRLTAIGATGTTVPEVVLVLGIISTALLTGMVKIGTSAWQNARTIERMRISTAISSATDAVWEWDAMTGMLHRSADLWRHMGYQPELMQGTLREWLLLVHEEDRERVTAMFDELREVGHDSFEAEYRVQTFTGDYHEVVDRGRVVERDGDGRVRRVMGITADVSRSRRAQQELREVEALSGMGRVAARVAHEINNPLAGIRSAFTLIKDAVPLDHPHQHYVGAIEREVERIGNVTRQLYEVYRPEDEAGEASLSTICGDAMSLLSQVNRSANVEFDLQLDGVPPVVPVSGGLLRQIVYNLVQNAVDASPYGGTVDIVGGVERRHLVLSVLDQGPGVPMELRQKIFEPFFTTKDATVRTSGMGLGLTMVARSVAAAGGTIEVGDVEGGGARFTVRLPLSDKGSNT